MKDVKSGDLKFVGQMSNLGFVLLIFHHHVQPFSIEWHKSHDNLSPGNVTELQISQVQEIKTSEKHFPNDIIKTPV